MKDKIIEILTKHSNTDTQVITDLHGRVYVIDPMDYHKIADEIKAKSKEEAGERYREAVKLIPKHLGALDRHEVVCSVLLAAFGKEDER